MARIIKIYFLLLLILGTSSCYKELVLFDAEPTAELQLSALLKLDNTRCSYDRVNGILRFSIPYDSIEKFSPIVEFQDKSELYFEGKQLRNHEKNTLGLIKTKQTYEIEIRNSGASKKLKLTFTNLPVVQIICDDKIYDEPKSLARIETIGLRWGENQSSFAGIEVRGKHSRDYPKQSFGFELWESMNNTKIQTKSLLGINKNSDWILNGAIVDPSRIRNLVSFKIWNSLSTTGNRTLNSGIHPKPIELFFNNEFRGIYLFSENMNQYTLNATNDAVLYKAIGWGNGATKFETFEPEISATNVWNGWEQKFPDYKEKVNWIPLNELYNLVLNEVNHTFSDKIADYINMEILIDYFLFLNLVSAPDNTGKNIFLYKENPDSPFELLPWDLDGSWGILFDGQKTGYKAILTNNLFERLYETNPNNYRLKVKSRWFHLRERNFKEEALDNSFNEYFELLNSSDIVQMENMIWDANVNLQKEKEYIESWTANRLQFLDKYFENF